MRSKLVALALAVGVAGTTVPAFAIDWDAYKERVESWKEYQRNQDVLRNESEQEAPDMRTLPAEVIESLSFTPPGESKRTSRELLRLRLPNGQECVAATYDMRVEALSCRW